MVAAREHFGLGLLPYFPLAKGLLTGKVTREGGIPTGTRLADQPDFVTDQRRSTAVEDLQTWADEHGRPLLDVAFGGLLATAARSPRSSPERPSPSRCRQRRGRRVAAHRGQELAEITASGADRPQAVSRHLWSFGAAPARHRTTARGVKRKPG